MKEADNKANRNEMGAVVCGVWRNPMGRKAQPIGETVDTRMLQSTPESGECADYDVAEGSRTDITVDTNV